MLAKIKNAKVNPEGAQAQLTLPKLSLRQDARQHHL